MKFVFSHGLIGAPSDWTKVIAALEPLGHECVSLDLPYFKDSITSIKDYSDQAFEALAPEFKDGTAVVVGHSLGGLIALSLSDSFSDVFLVGTYTGFGSYPLPRRKEKVVDWLAELVYDPSAFTQAEIDSYLDLYFSVMKSPGVLRKMKTLKTATADLQHEDYYERFQDKIHLVLGEHDKLSPPEIYFDLKQRFPGFQLHEISECGHAIPLEKPEKLAKILHKFAVERSSTQQNINLKAS